ncbi:MAG: DNA internalization-related competence protein ComEC/Rec2 [Bacilli bacterium]|nr:DNA internalization-related competence protein ComEC/Rec2 [Bacilli bacterium]
MKRLKTILQFNKFYFIVTFLLLVLILLTTKIIKYQSVYENGQSIITGKVSKVIFKDDKISFTIKAKEKIQATYYLKENEEIKINENDYISIEGNISTPRKNTIKNTFNYQKYLYNNHIYKTVNIKKINYIQKSNNVFVILKNKIVKRACVSKYLCLFITGDKTLLESSVYDSFKDLGIAHLIAISSMHISIFVSILRFILKYVKQSIENIIIILFLLFYAFIVGFTPSVMRVVICFILDLINKKHNININKIKILMLSSFLLIILNPFIIYNLGFIYSYLTSMGIILSHKFHSKKYWKNIIIITFFATLFTLPVNINLNYEINLLSLLTNFMMVPLISFFIYPFSILTFLFHFLLPIFNFVTNIMEKLIIITSKVSFFTIIIPKINPIFTIIYYFLIILFIYYGYKRFLFFIVCFLLFNKGIYRLDSSYQISFFDVGQGDSMAIIYPYKKKMVLIDTGANQNYHVSNDIILFFKSIGITSIKQMIFTHGDFDHMGEAINLVNSFKVEKVIFNCGPYNDLEKELIKVLDKKKIPYYSCIKELNIDNNKLYFLQTKEYDNENDNSNVIYTELNGYKFMFMGDASTNTEKEILSKYNLPDIDVLKVGHHGSKTSSGREFIDEIRPKYSIISVGKKNRYGHPNKEVLDNLNNSKIYRTDIDGSIMFKIKNNKLRIETCSP